MYHATSPISIPRLPMYAPSTGARQLRAWNAGGVGSGMSKSSFLKDLAAIKKFYKKENIHIAGALWGEMCENK